MALRAPLTSKDLQLRRRGMKLLTDVIASVPSDFFNDKEALLLLEFLCARLDDHHSITPISLDGLLSLVSGDHHSLTKINLAGLPLFMKGLDLFTQSSKCKSCVLCLSDLLGDSCCYRDVNSYSCISRDILFRSCYQLSKYKSLASSDVIRVVRAIFGNVTVQTLVQADRLTVYNIIEYLLTYRKSDMVSLGSEFPLGVVQCIDSEKDPRNLLVVFNLVTKLAHSFDLNMVAEELFEVVSCYYPIDFSPPPESGITVTKDQLVGALNEALISTPLFAPYCLPLLLEKLASSIVDARIDSLRTLTLCCRTYKPDNVHEFSSAFWNLFKSEVFAQRVQTEQLALTALTAITKCLSTASAEDGNGLLVKFISMLFEDCCKYLREPPDKTVFGQSMKLLSAACEASNPACCALLKLTIPLVLAEFHLRSQVSDRHGLLSALLSLLKAVVMVSQHTTSDNPLAEFKSVLFTTFISLLTNANSSLRSSAVACLCGLLRCHSLLSADECHLVAKHALAIFLSDGDANVRNECLLVLSFLAVEHSEVVKQSVLPVLVEALHKDSAIEGIALGCHVNVPFILNALASLSLELSLVSETLPVIMTYINDCSAKSSSAVEEQLSCACKALKSVVDVMVRGSAADYFVTWLLPRIAICVVRCCSTSDQQAIWQKLIVVDLVATVRVVVQHSKEGDISPMTSSVVALFLNGDLGMFQSFSDRDLPLLKPFDRNSSTEHVPLIHLLSAVVCSLPLSMEIPKRDQLLSRLRDVSLYHQDHDAADAAGICLAGLLNKTPLDLSVESLLHDLKSEITALLSSAEETVKLRALNLCIWLLKAAVLRNHSCQVDFTQILINSLADGSVASIATDGFRRVLTDCSTTTTAVFTADSHSIVTLMYRQRFFTICLPCLLSGYRSASSERKHFYVTSLTHLMQAVPKEVFISEIKQLLPVLMQSLMSAESSLWLSSIEMVTDLCLNNPDTLHSNVDDLIRRTLELSAYSGNLRVRHAATRCLSELAEMPAHLTLRHQSSVLRQLGERLDDHKRIVRQEAARARNLWFLIGSADE